jgi:hypothetical protein
VGLKKNNWSRKQQCWKFGIEELHIELLTDKQLSATQENQPKNMQNFHVKIHAIKSQQSAT